MPLDTESILAAYDDVRSDVTDTCWAFIHYDGDDIVFHSSGAQLDDEFKSRFEDDTRAFAFVRVTTGDEMSRRAKFALLTWCGSGVGALQRAKMSTDKPQLKRIIQHVACDLQISEVDELSEDYIRAELIKAGGANYGTGQ